MDLFYFFVVKFKQAKKQVLNDNFFYISYFNLNTFSGISICWKYWRLVFIEEYLL